MAALFSDEIVVASSNACGSGVTPRPPDVANVVVADNSSASYIAAPTPQPACSPIALPTTTPNVLAAAVATTSIHAALPSEDVKPEPTPLPTVVGSIGRHACPYCSLVCNKPSVLQKHIRAHTNERPFPCIPCGFAFKTRSNLYKHCRSRSHSMKLEEISGGAAAAAAGSGNSIEGVTGGLTTINNNETKMLNLPDDELMMVEDEDDVHDHSAVVKDEEGATSGEERVEQPRKLIYKPKFHQGVNFVLTGSESPAATTADSLTTTTTKLSMHLELPTTKTTLPSPLISSRSTPSTPLSLKAGGGSVFGVPSPESLQRHISKLISENQAIVETTDSLWSRKFYRKENGRSVSLSDISNCSSSGSGSGSIAGSANSSRCSSAVSVPSPPSTQAEESAQPLNLTMSRGGATGGGGGVAPVPAAPASAPAPDTVKFARPTSLPLQQGTFAPRKMLLNTMTVLPLISPDTPRPNKSFGQLYIGGNAYTYLGLKSSTRGTFCTLHKSQPTYVSLSPEHNKISMYSNWMVRSEADPYLRGVSMSCYNSKHRYSPYTVAHSKSKGVVTHSSSWVDPTTKLATILSGSGGTNDDVDDEHATRTQQPEHGDEGSSRVAAQTGADEEENRDKEKNLDYSEEREVAESLMLLSKISHQKVSEQYANAGLVPWKGRPITQTKTYSAAMSSRAPSPVLICLTEQHERDRVFKNAELVRELIAKPGSIAKQICDLPTQSGDRYYFGSSSEKEVAKVTSDLEAPVRQSDSATVTSDFPVDLSSKNTLDERKIIVPTTVPNGVSPRADNSTLMLHTYLKERALLDLKMKQQYQAPHIKTEQRDFEAKFNVYNEAFQKGAAAAAAAAAASNAPHHPSTPLVATTAAIKAEETAAAAAAIISSPKLKRHFVYENEDAAATDKKPVTVYVMNESTAAERAVSDSVAKDGEGSAAGPAAAAIVDPTEKGVDCQSSVIIVVSSSNSAPGNSPKRLKAEFISPNGGPMPKYASMLEDGRSKCVACDKIFTKLSQLRLHVNVHYMEHPFRCEACSISFRTKGHLHKHLGSNSHVSKVNMNSTGYGQTSTANPRPFKCDDCTVGFRIHGHLAKHLRSKMHIMKLECLGKLPFGTYAEMERCGVSMNDIDTTDCENSLESLQTIAKKVVGSVMYVGGGVEEGSKMITDKASF